MSEQWYLWRDEQRYGPYTWQELISATQAGRVAPSDLLWSPSVGDWTPAAQIAGLLSPTAPAEEAAPASGRRGRRRFWMLAGVAVALAVAALATWFLWLRGDDGADLPSAVSDRESSLTAVALLNVPGKKIPLLPGGALFVPEGALPGDALAEVEDVEMPPLPEGVEPLGRAVAINTAVQPSQPLVINLPMPAGVSDPSGLTLIRVQPDGSTTLLMTTVEAGELVAATPGFSLFGVVRLEGEERSLIGKRHLLPGEKATYRASLAPLGKARNASWKVDGGARIVSESEDAITIQAGEEDGRVILSYECTDVERGVRWYGAVAIEVTPESPDLEHGFLVSVTTRTATIRASRTSEVPPVYISASVHGQFQPPITWRWDLGDGTKGGPESSGAAATGFALPEHRYSAERERTYSVRVWAKDGRGREVVGKLPISVLLAPMEIMLDGPERLQWQEGGVSADYSALVLFGAPPYTFEWGVLPAMKTEHHAGETSVQPVRFDQPGGHLLALFATDQQGRRVATQLPVRVVGGEALDVEIGALPQTAEPGDEVTASVIVRGGVLAVNGQKTGYTLIVHWGDGSEPVVVQDVGSKNTPAQGSTAQLAHRYAKAGDYTVSVRAADATRTLARVARGITITETEETRPVIAPTASGPNTPPVAEDIAASTEMDVSAAITLKGSDADGDDLIYAIVDAPEHGDLTDAAGSPLVEFPGTPFLTYKPRAGYVGADAFAYSVDDGRGGTATAIVEIEVTPAPTRYHISRWVLTGPPTVNVHNEPTKTDPDKVEPRFQGSFTNHDISATSISMAERWVDHEYEAYNITLRTDFDAPPEALTPGEIVKLTATFSHGGTLREFSPGAQFWYSADKQHRNIISPQEVLAYYPWASPPSPTNTKEWTLTAPDSFPGDTFQIWASWWNCPACTVMWEYRAE